MVQDKIFKNVLRVSAVIIFLLIILMFSTLLYRSLPSIRHSGIRFWYTDVWNPVEDNYGSLAFLAGTLLTSFLALIMSLPFSLAISILLGEYLKQGIFSNILKTTIELLAGIPSVIYGLWGLFVLVPVMQQFQMKIGVIPYGVGMFTSSIILAIMIIPYSASISKEVINMVPNELKEAAYSLGATKYEVIRRVSLPYAKSGIFAGILLSLGRALGETMAVTMVIGNRNSLPSMTIKGIFDPANTMASIIANEFAEATTSLFESTLIQVGLVLFIVTALISYIGKRIIARLQKDIQ